MPKIERKEYVCIFCEGKFLSGDWMGCAGNKFRRHQVEPVTYHSKHDNHVICCTKEATVLNPTTGESQKIPGYQAQFVNGHYTTSDPEVQEVLNRILAEGGLVSLDAYVDSKLTDHQKAERAKGQLAEQSELLKKVQQENERLKAQIGEEKNGNGDEPSAAAIPGQGSLSGRRQVRA
ncbi:MAG TPA: hypothetical protein VMW38_11825 [Terriglobia bacterium]|nr:hypothetical protein [Terriglobia bacterium]